MNKEKTMTSNPNNNSALLSCLTKPVTIGRLMGYLHRHSRMYFHREFSRWNMGSGCHPFLMILWQQDGLTLKELTHSLHLDKANTTRTIARLTKLGYVRKKKDENDGRAFRIYLTEKGRKLIPQMKKVMMHWTNIMTDGLSDEEKREAIRLLQKMADNAVTHVRQS